MKYESRPLSGELLDDTELTLAELCRTCRLSAEQVLELVEEGIVQPRGRQVEQWRFHGTCVRRIRCAVTLRRDLGVNWAGAGLALELLEEIDTLRRRLQRRS